MEKQESGIAYECGRAMGKVINTLESFSRTPKVQRVQTAAHEKFKAFEEDIALEPLMHALCFTSGKLIEKVLPSSMTRIKRSGCDRCTNCEGCQKRAMEEREKNQEKEKSDSVFEVFWDFIAAVQSGYDREHHRYVSIPECEPIKQNTTTTPEFFDPKTV